MDLGRLLGRELEEAASPLTGRIDAVLGEVKEIKEELRRLNDALEALQPLINVVRKLQGVWARFAQRRRRD